MAANARRRGYDIRYSSDEGGSRFWGEIGQVASGRFGGIEFRFPDGSFPPPIYFSYRKVAPK